MISDRTLRETITLYFVTYPGGSGSGETDRYGNATEEVSEGVDVPAAVEPFRLSKELLDDQDRREERIQVVISPLISVDGLSRFEWRGNSYEVHGEPHLNVHRNGVHHLEFLGRRIIGG